MNPPRLNTFTLSFCLHILPRALHDTLHFPFTGAAPVIEAESALCAGGAIGLEELSARISSLVWLHCSHCSLPSQPSPASRRQPAVASLLSTCGMNAVRKAVALDIDGVLLRGSQVIAGAKQAVQRLAQANIPFVFVTNGGGVREEVKAAQLSAKLDLGVHKEQVILCHTPFSELVPDLGEKRVLVIGRDSCLDVARSYGFRNLCQPIDFFRYDHHILPTRAPSIGTVNTSNLDQEAALSQPRLDSVEAALIFHDPVDWSLEMQVLSDVLVTHRPGQPSLQRIPLYACNLDIVYTNEYHLPRFTQGAFLDAFQSLFRCYHQIPLHIEKYGKPFPVQYHFAEKKLQAEALRQSLASQSNSRITSETRFYGIGDNPLSDIQGANAAGAHWTSILVRTGVFQSGLANDLHHPADAVCADIQEAVDWVIRS